MGKVGKPPIPKELHRNYTNKTYSRIAIYPKTHQKIKKLALDAEMPMMDWLDNLIEQTKLNDNTND
jgi:hypothetical protein